MYSKARLDREQIEIADDVMVRVLSGKTHAERIRIGFNIWISSRDMLTAHLRKSHPEWDENMLLREVARRLSHGAV